MLGGFFSLKQKNGDLFEANAINPVFRDCRSSAESHRLVNFTILVDGTL